LVRFGLIGLDELLVWIAVVAFLEVWSPARAQILTLEDDRVTVGQLPSNGLVIDWDPLVSRLHALIERYPAGWCLRDMDSRNGTFVNGEPVRAERPLRHGDQIRIGNTRLVFRQPAAMDGHRVTAGAPPAPNLTLREREVLLALCRPMLQRDVFTEPSSAKEMAQSLYVTEAAVKQHLLKLYGKFDIHDSGERRRVRLANEALRRGAVSFGDLES
jgi:hypothetical protein